MREVAVVGIGMIKWGELWEKSLRDMAVEAALKCFEDAGTDRADVLTIGNMTGGLFNGQEHLGSLIGDYLGNPRHIPAMRVESACASGGMAVRAGFLEVASGMADYALVIGVEKMTDVSGGEATLALATASDQDYEAFHGVTFPGLYAMLARAHMHKYNTSEEALAEVAVKNHRNGSLNLFAQFPFTITREQVMNSTMVSDPLRLLHCSPITDGACALLLASSDEAKKSKHPPVFITGSAHATDTIALAQREDILKLEAIETASNKALKMAGKTIKDIDFAEVHDCFTIAEIMVMEALGAVPPGQGGPATLDGLTALDGEFPINTSGGLKSKGHPVGATGVVQIAEAVTQLRGQADKRQIPNARAGLTQNMGGSGGSCVVHVLEAK
jgi:acetyl-CoA C-acetyltransferase